MDGLKTQNKGVLKMKKKTSNTTEQNQSSVIQFSSIRKTKNGSYAVWIGKNVLFLHPNLLKAVDKNSKAS